MTSPLTATSVINGRYRLEQWIRRTTLSDDYEAHDILLDRAVIFKALLPDLAADRRFIERFRAQAQATANLSHPALASVFDWGRDAGGIEGREGPTYYLIAEQMTGRTLTDYLSSNGPMPLERAVHVLVGISSALAYAHRNGVIHGGLTPDGVTVSPTGVVKVFDLGLDAALGASWVPPSDHPELALWRTPEQFRGEPAEPRTDVYELGLIAYYLVTGRVPFKGATVDAVAERHIQSIPAAPSKINPKVPKPFEAIIGRSMAKVLDERYPSIADQRAAFVRFRESRTAAAGPDVGVGASLPAVVGDRSTASSASPTGTASRQADIGADATTFAAPVAQARSVEPTNVEPTNVEPTDDATMVAAPGRRDRGRSATPVAPDNVGRRTQKRESRTSSPEPVIGSPDRDFDDLHKGTGKRTALYAVVLIALLAILGGLVFLLYKQLGLDDKATANVAVPSVVGRPSAEAESAISAAGLISETILEANSSVAADVVFDQSPSAGSNVASEAKVIIKVSTGAAVPTVPNVVGDTIDTARSKLAAAGFPVEIKETEDDSQPAGTVISQDPEADATTPEGTTVTIIVATSTGKIEIVSVAGKTPDEARLALTKAGFRIAVQTEASPTVAKDTVTRTDPVAGTKVDRGASVIIYVSGGNAVAVPSVLGQNQASAVTTLQGLGLKVDVTARAVVDEADAGKVVSQTPAPGKDVDPGSTVAIRIGQFDPSATTTKVARPTTTQPAAGIVDASIPPITVAPETAAPVTASPVESTSPPTAPPVTAPPVTAAPVTVPVVTVAPPVETVATAAPPPA